MKYFFEEIIEIERIPTLLASDEFSENERQYLLNLAKSSIHHKVIDLVLTELADEQMKLFFIEALDTSEDHASTLEMLKAKVEGIEEKVVILVKEAELELEKLMSEN